eukprot:TRINITY_DN7230_c0_g2_i1.p1 TRINITY_DN7230_c0_g2~~TRINITY_DN7230_c0_g2_i1.p1  ORF type:complete len:333 (-),score=36.41 TRINITY_DN7230_c0_g2_i1:55-1053(-)
MGARNMKQLHHDNNKAYYSGDNLLSELESGSYQPANYQPIRRHKKVSIMKFPNRVILVTFCLASILIIMLLTTIRQVLIFRVAPSTSTETNPEFEHLVIVAGHSVYVGTNFSDAKNENNWFLEDYQKVEGQVQSFLQHMEMGVRIAALDEKAILIFSGGQTRKDAGPRSEGISYWWVSDASAWFDYPEVRDRAFTEEYAHDSFQNLLFSICRFKEIAGNYPSKITVVGYSFKQKRFSELHREAIRFPIENFNYAGTPALTEAAIVGERITMDVFRKDPYGCSADLLNKKLLREPFKRALPYLQSCPELQSLIQYCGPQIFRKRLPWQNRKFF